MMTVCKQIFREILSSTKSIARQIVTLFVSISLTFNPLLCHTAFADPSNIVPDGTTNTTLDLSPNNITVVNIATPTQSGTSMNNFDQFNVDQTGAILNNSSIVVNTQLGGWIYANPHLANGSQASVIVGEVTGNMPSSLLGYTEIAGGKAEFVLLNPNGIMASNAGFINISQLTLATGSGIYNADGALSGVNMGTGNFSVSGLGLDASLVDYFRVISKNVQLSAPIWAKDELAIYQGSSNFNTSTNTFSGVANPQAGQTIGIDIAALGSMYAGKATLVASDLGLGVNIASDVIASSGGITITANGDIVYNNLTSATNTVITANNGGNVTQNGDLSSGGNTNLTAANNISIAGTSLSSTGNTTITAGGNISNSNSLSLATNNFTTTSDGNTTLQNVNATVSGQTNITANNLTVTGSNIASTGGFISNVTNATSLNNTTVSSSGNVALTTKDLAMQTAIIATSGGITENASGNITQDSSQTIAIGAITINASTLTNQNSSLIQTSNALNITLTSNLNNTGSSSIASSLNATITAVNGTNSTNSYIISGGNFNGSFSGTLSNSAKIAAFGSITVNNLNNQNGYLEAGTSVLITNNNFGLNNSGGTIQSDGGNTTINSNYQFSNTNGQINSANDINLNIKSNQNYTDINSKINAGGNIYLNSAGYDITEGSGVKFTTSNLFQVTSRDFTNSSDIKVGYIDFNLSNALTNNANLISTADSQYIIRKNIVNTGTIASGATLLLQGANITNTNVGGSTGLIYSAGNMEVAGSISITNNANSAIVSGGTLGIYADTLITNGSNAQMWSVGNLTLAGYGNTSVATFNNGSTAGAAYLKSQANMQIYANQVNNIGKDNAPLTENNAYTVATVGYGGYPGMNSSKIMSQEVATNILTSTNSKIVAGGSMLINGNVLNQTGDILAGTNLTINGNVTNNITHFTTRSLSESWANTYEDCVFGAFGGVFCSTEHDWWGGSHTNTFSSLTPSRIAAGGNLTISGSQISNDSGTATFQNNTPLGGSSGGSNSGYSGSYATSFANSNALNSSNIASPNLNFNALTNPAIFNVSQNPPSLNLTNANGQNINFTYLYEANPAFNVQSNFLTSDYFFTHLDYSPSRQIVMIGDPYTERRIVEDTIAKTGMVQYLGNGAIDGLYANGLRYLEGRPTQVGYVLIQSQIDSLQEDIIIPVEKTINGKTVMVPQVYWSSATLAKAKDRDKAGGQIYADGDVVLLSNGDLTNKGYIGSGGNTSILIQGDLSNIGGEIQTGGSLGISGKNILLNALTLDGNQVQNVSKLNVGVNLLINATDNISAYGASIKAVGNTNFTAGQNILLAAATSSSSMSAQGGDISETKSKAVASTLESGGNINIKSGGDFSLLAGQDTYSSHFAHTDDGALGTSSSIAKDSSGLTNIASSIKGNNVSIDSGNDATIVASNITAANNLSLEAKGNTNILASKDMTSNFSQETSSAGFVSNSIDVKNHYNESVVSSNLTAGNSLLVSSGKDVNILGSNITGTDGNIVAGYYQDSNGVITRNDGSVNVMSVTEMAKNYEYRFNEHFDVGGFLVATVSGAVAGCLVGGPGGCAAGMAAGIGVGINSKSGYENSDESLLITQISSNLTFDNLEITVSKDVNVQSSNINIVEDLVINAENFNINDAYNTDKKTSIHIDISPDYVALAMGGAVAGFAGAYAQALAHNGTFGYNAAYYSTYISIPVIGNGIGTIGSSPVKLVPESIYTNRDTTESIIENSVLVKSQINALNIIVNIHENK